MPIIISIKQCELGPKSVNSMHIVEWIPANLTQRLLRPPPLPLTSR